MTSKPDCGHTYTNLKLDSIVSNKLEEEVLTAIYLDSDRWALVIETEDLSFADTTVGVMVKVQDNSTTSSPLLLNVNFVGPQLKFDTD